MKDLGVQNVKESMPIQTPSYQQMRDSWYRPSLLSERRKHLPPTKDQTGIPLPRILEETRQQNLHISEEKQC